MKDFRDIKEGLLKGMDDTLDRGEAAAQHVINRQILQQYFYTNSQSARKFFSEKHSFIRFTDADAEKTFDKCCSYDGAVLTIDLTKEADDDIRLRICVFNGGSDLPMIKIIDKRRTKIKSINADCCDDCNILITAGDDKPVDVESFIHYDTNVSSVAYERCGTTERRFKTNVFPGKVRDLCAYYCYFDHINTKAWPSCKLWISQHTVFKLFMQQIGKGNESFELGYPGRNILI